MSPPLARMDLATVAADLLRSYEGVIGETPSPALRDMPGWQAEFFVWGVDTLLANPSADAAGAHAAWAAHVGAAGWTYGAAIDPSARTHPLLAAWSDLDARHRAKFALLVAVAGVLVPLLGA